MVSTGFLQKVLNAITGTGSNVGEISSTGGCSYLALSSTKPNVDGTNITEPSGNNYARVLIGGYGTTYSFSNKMTSAAVSTDSGVTKVSSTNSSEIHFNEATGSWGVLPYFAIYRSNVCVYVGKLETAISPVANTVPLIRVGELEIYFTAETLA